MSFATPGAKTQKLPSIPAAAGPAEATSRIAIRPVFVDDGGRRKRVLVRTGYLAAAACIAYLVVVGISLTAGPAGPLAGLSEPLASIVAPVEVPAPVPSTTREANVSTPAPATVRAVPTRPVPASPAPSPVTVAVLPVSVPATTEPTTAPATRVRRTRTSRTTEPAVVAPTAAVPKPELIQ